jgi:UDP-N-acetylmuramyl pentapeptide phosphotransferase/UDP-N-acetylglucosamine-1-phosphate transferase
MKSLSIFVFFVFVFSFSFILFKYFPFFAKKFNLIDTPNDLNIHKNPTPTSSGIIFIFLLLSGILFLHSFYNFQLSKNYFLFFFGVLAMFLVGFIDDKKDIHPLIRLIIQTSIVYICLAIFDFQSLTVPLKVTIFFLVYFWVYLINIINFTDGSDGFLATNSIVVFTAVFLFYLFNADYNIPFSISLVFLPILLAYLFFNKPFAKIFMGDSGSMVIGFCIGYCAIELILIGEYFIVISFLSYTFIDCTYTLIKKTINGSYPWARMFDYQFLVPIKNNLGHKYVFRYNLIFNIVNLFIIIFQIFYNMRALCLISIFLSIMLILKYNNKV